VQFEQRAGSWVGRTALDRMWPSSDRGTYAKRRAHRTVHAAEGYGDHPSQRDALLAVHAMMRSGRPAYQSPCTCQNCCRPLDCLVLHFEDPARPAYPYRLDLFSTSQEPGTGTFTFRIALRTRCCKNARLLGPSSDRLAHLHRPEHPRFPAVRVRAWTEPRHRRQIVVHLLPCRDPQSKTDSSFL